ncbi:MAG: trehalose-6-phosphate synthase [Luteimonas sp.]
MSRLVVVSNRVVLPNEQPVGGLSIALVSALQAHGGLWFGSSGAKPKADPGTVHVSAHEGIEYRTLDLSVEDIELYYNGFSNRTLWPLLHFRPDLLGYSRQSRDAYERVNALFAAKLAPLLRDTDTVWIHDYHLIPLGGLLRALGIGCRVGFFLHVPMPSADTLAALPEHDALFSTLASYDLVGFQTVRDVERYQDYLRLFGQGSEVAPGRIRSSAGREFRIAAFPVGIDTKLVAQQAQRAADKPGVRRLRASLAEHALAIGVDRLDYSKGLPERFRSFAHYLECYPAQRGNLSFLQISPLSRTDIADYQVLRAELEGLAGRINGAYADPEWTPIRYVNSTFAHDVLTGFYRIADIGLVTTLRDGMNLVAKEYVASQDPACPGVLILSRFAGAASELRDALLVNPYDADEVADAVARALAMPLAEKLDRWRGMMAVMRENDATSWRTSYVQALLA